MTRTSYLVSCLWLLKPVTFQFSELKWATKSFNTVKLHWPDTWNIVKSIQGLPENFLLFLPFNEGQNSVWKLLLKAHCVKVHFIFKRWRHLFCASLESWYILKRPNKFWHKKGQISTICGTRNTLPPSAVQSVISHSVQNPFCNSKMFHFFLVLHG